MNCLEVREQLPELAVGTLSDADRSSVEEHLAWCAGCRKEATELGQAAATIAFALPPANVPQGLGDRVLAGVNRASGARGSRRRARLTAGLALAAAIAVASLGWGAVMADRAGRFEDRARLAQQRQAVALEGFRKVLAGLPLRSVATDDTHLGQLAPVPGQVGGGAALELVSPTTLDFVLVIVNGLEPSRESPLPYRVTLHDAAGDTLRAGRIARLDADGAAELFRQFDTQDLAGYTTVYVRDARGDVLLRGTVDQDQASGL